MRCRSLLESLKQHKIIILNSSSSMSFHQFIIEQKKNNQKIQNEINKVLDEILYILSTESENYILKISADNNNEELASTDNFSISTSSNTPPFSYTTASSLQNTPITLSKKLYDSIKINQSKSISEISKTIGKDFNEIIEISIKSSTNNKNLIIPIEKFNKKIENLILTKDSLSLDMMDNNWWNKLNDIIIEEDEEDDEMNQDVDTYDESDDSLDESEESLDEIEVEEKKRVRFSSSTTEISSNLPSAPTTLPSSSLQKRKRDYKEKKRKISNTKKIKSRRRDTTKISPSLLEETHIPYTIRASIRNRCRDLVPVYRFLDFMIRDSLYDILYHELFDFLELLEAIKYKLKKNSTFGLPSNFPFHLVNDNIEEEVLEDDTYEVYIKDEDVNDNIFLKDSPYLNKSIMNGIFHLNLTIGRENDFFENANYDENQDEDDLLRSGGSVEETHVEDLSIYNELEDDNNNDINDENIDDLFLLSSFSSNNSISTSSTKSTYFFQNGNFSIDINNVELYDDDEEIIDKSYSNSFQTSSTFYAPPSSYTSPSSTVSFTSTTPDTTSFDKLSLLKQFPYGKYFQKKNSLTSKPTKNYFLINFRNILKNICNIFSYTSSLFLNNHIQKIFLPIKNEISNYSNLDNRINMNDYNNLIPKLINLLTKYFYFELNFVYNNIVKLNFIKKNYYYLIKKFLYFQQYNFFINDSSTSTSNKDGKKSDTFNEDESIYLYQLYQQYLASTSSSSLTLESSSSTSNINQSISTSSNNLTSISFSSPKLIKLKHIKNFLLRLNNFYIILLQLHNKNNINFFLVSLNTMKKKMFYSLKLIKNYFNTIFTSYFLYLNEKLYIILLNYSNKLNKTIIKNNIESFIQNYLTYNKLKKFSFFILLKFFYILELKSIIFYDISYHNYLVNTQNSLLIQSSTPSTSSSTTSAPNQSFTNSTAPPLSSSSIVSQIYSFISSFPPTEFDSAGGSSAASSASSFSLAVANIMMKYVNPIEELIYYYYGLKSDGTYNPNLEEIVLKNIQDEKEELEEEIKRIKIKEEKKRLEKEKSEVENENENKNDNSTEKNIENEIEINEEENKEINKKKLLTLESIEQVNSNDFPTLYSFTIKRITKNKERNKLLYQDLFLFFNINFFHLIFKNYSLISSLLLTSFKKNENLTRSNSILINYYDNFYNSISNFELNNHDNITSFSLFIKNRLNTIIIPIKRYNIFILCLNNLLLKNNVEIYSMELDEQEEQALMNEKYDEDTDINDKKKENNNYEENGGHFYLYKEEEFEDEEEKKLREREEKIRERELLLEKNEAERKRNEEQLRLKYGDGIKVNDEIKGEIESSEEKIKEREKKLNKKYKINLNIIIKYLLNYNKKIFLILKKIKQLNDYQNLLQFNIFSYFNYEEKILKHLKSIHLLFNSWKIIKKVYEDMMNNNYLEAECENVLDECLKIKLQLNKCEFFIILSSLYSSSSSQSFSESSSLTTISSSTSSSSTSSEDYDSIFAAFSTDPSSFSTLSQNNQGIYKAYQNLLGMITELNNIIPLLIKLQSNTLSPRHIEQIHEVVQYKIYPNHSTNTLISSPSSPTKYITVHELIYDINILQYKEEITNIYNESKIEYNLEIRIHNILKNFFLFEFNCVQDSVNKSIYYITNYEELKEKIRDASISLEIILKSNYIISIEEKIKNILEQSNEWLKIIEELEKLQNYFLQQRNYFILMRIARLMSNNMKDYKIIEENYKNIIKVIKMNEKLYDFFSFSSPLATNTISQSRTSNSTSTTSTVPARTNPSNASSSNKNLLTKILFTNELGMKIEDNFNQILIKNYEKFPRLYLVSLKILKEIFLHIDLKNIFASLSTFLYSFICSSLEFDAMEANTAIALHSSSERLLFLKPCLCRNQLIDWLKLIDQSINDYINKDIKELYYRLSLKYESLSQDNSSSTSSAGSSSTSRKTLLDDIKLKKYTSQSIFLNFQIFFWKNIDDILLSTIKPFLSELPLIPNNLTAISSASSNSNSSNTSPSKRNPPSSSSSVTSSTPHISFASPNKFTLILQNDSANTYKNLRNYFNELSELISSSALYLVETKDPSQVQLVSSFILLIIYHRDLLNELINESDDLIQVILQYNKMKDNNFYNTSNSGSTTSSISSTVLSPNFDDLFSLNTRLIYAMKKRIEIHGQTTQIVLEQGGLNMGYALKYQGFNPSFQLNSISERNSFLLYRSFANYTSLYGSTPPSTLLPSTIPIIKQNNFQFILKSFMVEIGVESREINAQNLMELFSLESVGSMITTNVLQDRKNLISERMSLIRNRKNKLENERIEKNRENRGKNRKKIKKVSIDRGGNGKLCSGEREEDVLSPFNSLARLFQASLSCGIWLNFYNYENLSEEASTIFFTTLRIVHENIFSSISNSSSNSIFNTSATPASASATSSLLNFQFHLPYGGSLLLPLDSSSSSSPTSSLIYSSTLPRFSLLSSSSFQPRIFHPISREISLSFRPIHLYEFSYKKSLQYLLLSLNYNNSSHLSEKISIFLSYLVKNYNLTEKEKELEIILYNIIKYYGIKKLTVTTPTTSASSSTPASSPFFLIYYNIIKLFLKKIFYLYNNIFTLYDLRLLFNLFFNILYNNQQDYNEFFSVNLLNSIESSLNLHFLKKLCDKKSNMKRILILYGNNSIGKSSLLLKIFKNLKKNLDNLYLSCNISQNMTESQILGLKKQAKIHTENLFKIYSNVLNPSLFLPLCMKDYLNNDEGNIYSNKNETGKNKINLNKSDLNSNEHNFSFASYSSLYSYGLMRIIERQLYKSNYCTVKTHKATSLTSTSTAPTTISSSSDSSLDILIDEASFLFDNNFDFNYEEEFKDHSATSSTSSFKNSSIFTTTEKLDLFLLDFPSSLHASLSLPLINSYLDDNFKTFNTLLVTEISEIKHLDPMSFASFSFFYMSNSLYNLEDLVDKSVNIYSMK